MLSRKCNGPTSPTKRRLTSTEVASLNSLDHTAKRSVSKRTSPRSSKLSCDGSEEGHLTVGANGSDELQRSAIQSCMSRRVQPSTSHRTFILPSAPEEHDKDISSHDIDSDDGSEKDRYEVENILAKKGRGHTAQYLVKWLGYEEVTWLPARELDQSLELVEEFEKRDEKKKELAVAAPESRKKGYADQHRKGNFAVSRHYHQTPAGSSSNGLITTLNGQYTSVNASPEPTHPTYDFSDVEPELSKHVHRQTHFVVAQLGQSGIEKGHNVVKILAHKPKELSISRLEDVDFLINYAGESSNEFVEYEVCIREIPAHVAEYLARINPLL